MLEKTIIITDADGTLLPDNKQILDIDKAAIAEIVKSGGYFTIATGRGTALARVIVDEIGRDLMKLPAVIFNGAAVYDYTAEKFLWQCCLEESGQAYVRMLMEKFPGIGSEVLIGGEVYVVNTNKYEEMHLDFGNVDPIRCKFDEVPSENWLKALFVDHPKRIAELEKFVRANPCESVHAVCSGDMFFEVLPRGINKWTGISRMLELTGMQDYRTVAVGDYYNDLEMLEHSDIGVATGNAEPALKDIADFTVCNCNNGALHEVVEELKRRTT